MKMRNSISYCLALIISLAFQAAAQPRRPGTVDLGFTPPPRFGSVFAIAEQPDGRVLIGGYFGIQRLALDGQTDLTFNSPLESWPYGAGVPLVSAIALQPDGRILVGGQFMTSIQGPHFNLVRLLPNGAVDPTFETAGFEGGPDWPVECIQLLPDGRILIGGRFENYAVQPAPAIARLLPNGHLDPTFNPGAGPDEFILGMALQPDGRIVVRGNFSTFDGVLRGGVARLLPDGALDESFDPQTLGAVWVSAFALQGNDLIVSAYLGFGPGEPSHRLARLRPNGTVDPHFREPQHQGILSLAVQKDGRILVGGVFPTEEAGSRSQVIRLNPNGGWDPGFAQGAGAAGQIDDEWVAPSIFTMTLSKDRGVLAGGNFNAYNGLLRSGIVRLIGGFGP